MSLIFKKTKRDNSNINNNHNDNDLSNTNGGGLNNNNKSRNYKKSEIPSFLANLFEILQNNEYNDIIEWSENGKSFIVKNLTEFSEKVIPRYWKHNNFASFVRQVNIII